MSNLPGSKYEITLGGTLYQVSPVSIGVESDFERRLLGKVKHSLSELKLEQDEYFAMLKIINDSYACGDYKITGKQGQQSLRTIDGAVMLASLVFALPEAEMLPLVRLHGKEIGDLIALNLKESIGERYGTK
jgi:hypothetical protein